MTRNIITKLDLKPDLPGPLHLGEPGREIPTAIGQPACPDSYFDRLTKYVPVEIIGAYLLVEGIVRQMLAGTALFWALLVLLVIGIVGTWFFASRVLNVLRREQLMMTTFAFVVWVFTIGGWFSTLAFWAPGWGTVAVVIFGVMVQIIKLGPLSKPAPAGGD